MLHVSDGLCDDLTNKQTKTGGNVMEKTERSFQQYEKL